MIYVKRNELKEIIKKYRKGWYWFAISFVGCMLLAAAFIFVKNKKFEVYTSLKINGGSNSGSMMATLAKNSGFGDILGMGGTEIDNEITIMQSHHILYNAVKEIGMNVDYNSRPKIKRRIYWNDAPILLSTDIKNFSDTLSDYLMWKIKVSADGKSADILCKSHEYGKVCDLENVKLPASFETALGIFYLQTTKNFIPGKSIKVNVGWASYTACAQKLMEEVEFRLIDKKSDIIQISNKDANPNRTIDLLNAIVKNYEQYSVEAKNQSTQISSDMLQSRIDTVSHQLSVIEYQIEEYKRSHDMAFPDLEAQVAMEQISSIKQNLINLEIEQNNLSILKEYVKNPEHKFEPLPVIASVGLSSQVKPALVEYNNAIIKYQSLKRSAVGNNPTLIKAEENLETMRQSVIMTLESMNNATDKALQETRREESKILNLKTSAPVIEREYVELVRQQELKQKVLLLLQAQQEQNALTINQDTPRGQLVDKAYVNVKPSGPKAIVIILIALFFAIFMPMVWIRILDMTNCTIQTPDQIKDLEGFHGDIHVLKAKNEEDIKLLSMELDSQSWDKDICVVMASMQGESAEEDLASTIKNKIKACGQNLHNVEIIDTPAFTVQADAMYQLKQADVALLVVKQGTTRKENLAYVETLLDKGLMNNLVTAYLQS